MSVEQVAILTKVAEITGPTVALLLKEIIEFSKNCSYIRCEGTLLFEIPHNKMIKKMRQTSKNYWAMIERLEDAGLLRRHFITLSGQMVERQYTEIKFHKLASFLIGEKSNAPSNV